MDHGFQHLDPLTVEESSILAVLGLAAPLRGRGDLACSAASTGDLGVDAGLF